MHEIWYSDSARLNIFEVREAQLHILRLFRPSKETIYTVARALNIALTADINRSVGTMARATWLGPGAWMLTGVEGHTADFEAARGQTNGMLTDVANGRFALEVDGTAARDLLAKAIPIDLCPEHFRINHAASTMFAQIPTLIDHWEQGKYRLWFDISLRSYVRDWIDDAVLEFQTPNAA